MKKITYFLFCVILTSSLGAQTIAWSSDSENFADFSTNDVDGDGFNWGVFSGGGEDLGFKSGFIFFSSSWDSDPAPAGTPLFPDNLLFTPTFIIDATAKVINYKMKVGSTDDTFFAEKFAVYIYDFNATDPETLIYVETLSAGGDGTAKDIEAEIPATFAGKTVGIIVRHFDCTDENTLIVDDFEVSYSTTLSTTESSLEKISVFPNSVKDFIKIKTTKIIDAVTIVNQLGQNVMLFNKNEIADNTVNVSTLSKGFYFMVIEVENRKQSIRIIKE